MTLTVGDFFSDNIILTTILISSLLKPPLGSWEILSVWILSIAELAREKALSRMFFNVIFLQLLNNIFACCAIYTGETWSWKEEDNEKQRAFENDGLRTIVGVFRMNHINMDDIRSDLGIANAISDIIKKKRLKGFGYVLYKNNTSNVNY